VSYGCRLPVPLVGSGAQFENQLNGVKEKLERAKHQQGEKPEVAKGQLRSDAKREDLSDFYWALHPNDSTYQGTRVDSTRSSLLR
jgi:hypothetical protein